MEWQTRALAYASTDLVLPSKSLSFLFNTVDSFLVDNTNKAMSGLRRQCNLSGYPASKKPFPKHNTRFFHLSWT